MKTFLTFLAALLTLATFTTRAQSRAPQLLAGEKENDRKPLGLASAEIQLRIADDAHLPQRHTARA